MRVFVYWNLHKGGFSIRALDGAAKGKVVAHASRVYLSGVTLAVAHGARQRIRDGAPKEVHAGFRGALVAFDGAPTPQGNACGVASNWNAALFPTSESLEPITYNPRRDSGFVSRRDGRLIETARAVLGLTRADGRAECFARVA